MFKSARIKLTAWYVGIIIIISLVLSLPIYRVMVLELERGFRRDMMHVAPGMGANFFNPMQLFYDEPIISNEQYAKVVSQIKERVAFQLFIANLMIITASGFAAYFLAGKTLSPIESMVNDQKRFVADASHELRTPLTAMKTETEVALRDKKLDLSSSKILLKSNLEEMEKMQRLTNYLLSLSKYQNQQSRAVFQKILLNEVVDVAVKRVSSIAKNKRVSILQDVDSFMIHADRDSLAELFTIILDNAVKYSQENSQVIVRAKTIGHKAIVEIEDFGIGIKKADLPHIFDRFYRADESRTKTKTNGYGLGLSIAKSIVELHYGKITVTSNFGKGTTFKIFLPQQHN